MKLHGHTRRGWASPTYNSWSTMVQRCTNPRAPGFKDYGGRGITVCERWLKFANFLSDMGERPEGKSIDRINNDGNYEPSNCRWANQSEQNRNRRQRPPVEICWLGHPKTQRISGERVCGTCKRAKTRMQVLGWTEERAFAIPKIIGNGLYGGKQP